MTTHSSNQIIDVGAAIITLKIVGSILCGVATAYFEYRLFGRSVVAIALAPVGCGFLAASFFAPEQDRKFYFAALFTFLALSLFVGGLVRIPAYVYFWTFAFVVLTILVGLALYSIGSIATETETDHPTSTSDKTRDAIVLRDTKTTRRAWTYSTRNRIWNKYDRKCYDCHQPLHNCTNEHMHLDHRKPTSQDGPDIEENLTAYCINCMRRKELAISGNTRDEAESQKTKPTRRAWTPKSRKRIWNKNHRRCYICGQPLPNSTGTYMHLDHRKPISKGGPDTEENIAVSCVKCNLEKHDHDEPSLYSNGTGETGRTKR